LVCFRYISLSTQHKGDNDDGVDDDDNDNNNNNNNLRFISCRSGIFIRNTEEYLFKVPSKLEIS